MGAVFVLGGAAVWMGGLNQDEGWYLYAAQLVGEGQLPYRDFFFTQGPLFPIVYSAFAWTWRSAGLLGARLLTLGLGLCGIVFAMALVRRLVPAERARTAALCVFVLLGSNLYHLYYLTIPKTYALAGLFVILGFYLLAVAAERRKWIAAVAGLSLAFAAGTRISLGALLCAVGCWLVFKRDWRLLGWFCLGGFFGLGLAYGPFVLEDKALSGLIAAQKYHAARGGFDLTWTVGSFSRLVRWYLPVFVLLGLGFFRRLPYFSTPTTPSTLSTFSTLSHLLFFGFLAVFVVQMAAPFPYEDYQVPVMSLLAVYSVVLASQPSQLSQLSQPSQLPQPSHTLLLLALGMTWAGSFGSPLLEKWSVNGQDRFWSLKKDRFELAQLRDMARRIEALDPGGKDLLTQDLYLAVETGRKVPRGLEMGPFAMMSDAEWKSLLESAPCKVAALSGYSFAINPPKCDERPMEWQMSCWETLKRRYSLVLKEEYFGQNATTLLVLKRKGEEKERTK